MLDGGPQVIRDIAMATNFWLSLGYNLFGYNFGCMIASNSCLILGMGFQVRLSDKDIA